LPLGVKLDWERLAEIRKTVGGWSNFCGQKPDPDRTGILTSAIGATAAKARSVRV
jgi:hypothetical protein